MYPYSDIFQLILAEEANYKLPIPVRNGWDWSMAEHIRKTDLYKNSKFAEGANDNTRPFKNIIRPILNLAYRAEGFDVKDIVLFIDDLKTYFKSLLVKKYHERWARQNGIDTFIDDMVESYADYGGALVKNVNQKRPEVVPLSRIAFCDQTDILSGPLAEKHSYSPDELQEEEARGWENIEEVIQLSESAHAVPNVDLKARTPGKYIEVYEVHGVFPDTWLSDEETGEEPKFVRQLHIVTFYKSKEGEKKGITLYKGKEKESPYKVVLRDKIFGRALGLGGAEELFEPQVWTNYDSIRIKDMLDAASKTILKTTDPEIASRHPSGLKNLNNLSIVELGEGKDIGQVDTFPRNMALFEKAIADWEQHARQMGAATESIMGESPSSGTPFKLQELITAESHSLHEYRKGKLATFLDEIYKDWILPYISREITNGATFLAELDLEELQQVADSLVECQAKYLIKEKILNGETIDPTQVEVYKQDVRNSFMKGNKKFIEILKGEMKGAPLDVKVNIAGKQKNLSGIVDKLTNVFRTIVANPAILQTPQGAKLFNQILESSGLNPMDFTGFEVPAPVQPATIPEMNKGQVMQPA